MAIADRIKQGRIDRGMGFYQRVWALCSRVPAGRVVTYADIAQQLGGRAYRSVGCALHHNPYAPWVPCHRVVGSDGCLTGFASGLDKKRKMLQAEGVKVIAGCVDLDRYRFRF